VKIKLSELRSLIRSSVISEAPLAGIEPAGEEDWTKGMDSKTIARFKNYDVPTVQKDREEVKKFFNNENFRSSAIKLYKNLSVPIYVVPAFTWFAAGRGSKFDDRGRIKRTYERSEDASILAGFGVPPEKIVALEEARKQGAAIFVPLVENLEKGFLSTPWMIIHAMIDESTESSVMGKYVSEIVYLFLEGEDFDGQIKSKKQERYFNHLLPGVISSLTMKSARVYKFKGRSLYDIAAEILTQAILDTRGFHYNKTGDQEIDSLLAKISDLVSTARKDFEDAIRGKVIVIEAHIQG